ncbi:MAG TPA: helix-turn-helix domain-containing protein [Bacteroides sp.]|nr:helix-turn-helix domain-containing protein [Bacteroides sp.]
MSFTQSRQNEFLDKLTRITEANMSNEQFGASELAREAGMSHSNLHRRLKYATGLSISQFIRKVRLEKAYALLQESSLIISAIAFECGFRSVSYFNKCFRDQYGYPPGKIRKDEYPDSGPDNQLPEPSLKSPGTKRTTMITVASASVLVIATIILLTILKPFSSDNKPRDLSIAVLPFRNDSPDAENAYFINGIMEEVVLNLQAIKELRVPGRTSVEQYRTTTMSIPEIAEELGVNYIVEGSGQKYGDKVILRVQLLEGASDEQLWGDSYKKEIESIEVIIGIQSQIAQSIANELQAVITPAEKQRIEQTPTTNLTAYDFYQRGIWEVEKYWSVYQGYKRDNNREALLRAEDLFSKALEYDSTFARAYTQLAIVYTQKNYWETYLTENCLDSVLILANKALSYDDQLADAYFVKGYYYHTQNQDEQALTEYDRALELNPNDCWSYFWKGAIYENKDLVKSLDNIQKVILMYRGPVLPQVYSEISWVYGCAGFKERSCYYAKEAFILDGDSARYYSQLAFPESTVGNFEKAIEYAEKNYALDSTGDFVLGQLGLFHSFLDQYKESLRYFKEYDRCLKVLDKSDPSNTFRIGHALWVNGFKNEAAYYFNTALEFHNEAIELGRIDVVDNYYALACIHAFLGDKEKAYENLRLFKREMGGYFYYIEYLKKDPLLDSIRDEAEFQQIVRELEARYQAEHEKVRQWLEENDQL